MDNEAEAASGPEKKPDSVASIGAQVAKLSPGDRARLRRIYLTRSPAADGVVVGLMVRAGLDVPYGPAFAPWRLLAHVAALLSGTAGAQPHAPRGRLGEALFAARYSENRLLRLTGSRGEMLEDQVIRAARMLARGPDPQVNLWDILHLAQGDTPDAEKARLRIAHDYYSAAARA